MTNSLENRVALITGNSTGLGLAMGMALGKAGAKVPINYANNRARAEAALQAYQDAGIETMIVQADVTTAEGVDALVSAVEAEMGEIEILVPNATCEQPQRPIEEYDWEFYQAMLDFFVKSPFLVTRRVLGPMKEKKWGRIINITSEVYQLSVAPFSAYVAAKGGQVGSQRGILFG